MALDFSGHDLLCLYEQVRDDSDPVNWVIYKYTAKSNAVTVADSGTGGLEEFVEEFDDGHMMYGFCRVSDTQSGLSKILYVAWCGDGVPAGRKGKHHLFVNDVANFFKSFHVQINARSEQDLDMKGIMHKVRQSGGASYDSQVSPQKREPKSTNNHDQYSIEDSEYNAIQDRIREPVEDPAQEPIPQPREEVIDYSAQSEPISDIQAVVIYNYEAADESEINLIEGQVIYEIEKLDEGWWRGTGSDGIHGLFPSNYVEEQ